MFLQKNQLQIPNILILTLIAVFFSLTNAQNDTEFVNLKKIYPANPPVLKDNLITHTMSIHIVPMPEDFYTYFDPKANQLVIEFYGIYLQSDLKEFKTSPPFGALDIVNLPTTMSLRGLQAQIRIDMKSGWHIKTSVRGDLLEIASWQEIKPKEIVKPKNNDRWPLIAGMTGVSILTAFVVFLTISHAN